MPTTIDKTCDVTSDSFTYTCLEYWRRHQETTAYLKVFSYTVIWFSFPLLLLFTKFVGFNNKRSSSISNTCYHWLVFLIPMFIVIQFLKNNMHSFGYHGHFLTLWGNSEITEIHSQFSCSGQAPNAVILRGIFFDCVLLRKYDILT